MNLWNPTNYSTGFAGRSDCPRWRGKSFILKPDEIIYGLDDKCVNYLLTNFSHYGLTSYPDRNLIREDSEFQALQIGWKLVRNVKSNAIVFANSDQLLGVGAGQMSRIDSVKIAVRKVLEAGLNLKDAIMASDAFFPFSDSVEIAAKAGISAIIQPGGSIKDKDVIKKADELGIAMVFTGIRHFLH